jgi:DNA-binding transcriptional regulator GbsR (MarR family)
MATRRKRSELSPATRRAIADDMGQTIAETFGLPPMAGRVAGLLAVAEPPTMTAAQLQDALQASSGSVSQITRMLVESGAIVRTKTPGVRGDFFQVADHAWDDSNRNILEIVRRLRELADRTLSRLDGTTAEAADYFVDMQQYYGFLEEQLPALFARYRRSRRSVSSPGKAS